MIETNVCIVGAGPGGAAAALTLSYSGISCMLIDKAFFPRDKVCGDAISGKVTTILNRIDPDIVRRFEKSTRPQGVWGIRLVAPNHIPIDVPFKARYDIATEPTPGYVSKRFDFDNFLVDEVRRRSDIDFKEGISVESIEKQQNRFLLKDETGNLEVFTRLLIVANGAQSAFSRKYAGIEKEPTHYAGAVRAYFKNVRNFHPHGFIELHFLKDYIPGYFWAFPLPNGEANVGLGLRTDYISRRKLNLKKELLQIIKNEPVLKERFENAELMGDIAGYPLPLGSKKYRISGDNFMLVGDAAHLIDPLTGEGIGNAIYSGWIAAEQVKTCFEKNDFSKEMMLAYDRRVARVLGAEMQLSYQLQRLLTYPRLFNFFANRLHGSKKLMDILSRMYTDFELRKQLASPLFWIKLVFSK